MVTKTNLLLAISVICLLLSCDSEMVEWSPENAALLFMSNKDGNAEIYFHSAQDSGWVNLSNNKTTDNWPVWSPDGQKIAFQRWNEARTIDVWVMNADGSNQTQLTDHPDHDYLPSWAPDGKRISFTSWRTETADEERAPHIYIMNADGSDQRRLVSESLNTSSGASWHPDGKRFVFTMKVDDNGGDIFEADADGTNLHRLTEDTLYNGAATYSPDGSMIAYYADNGTTSNIMVMNADGTGKRNLTNSGQSWYPRWSPDGKWIVYTAANPEGGESDLDIQALPVFENSQPRKIAGGGGREAEGSWKPVYNFLGR